MPWRQRRTAFDQAQRRLGQPRAVVGLGRARFELAVYQLRVIRVVGFQDLQAGVSQVVQVQTLIGLNHDRQAVTDRWGFLEVFDNVATAVGRCHVGLTGQIVVGNVDLVGCQQVAQIDHALLGVGCVAAVRVAAGQLGELVIRIASSARVTLGLIQRQEAGDDADVLVERGQALEVIGVIDVRVLRVQTNETLGGRLGSFRLAILVVGVDQLELRLVSVATERITRLQRLELLGGAVIAIVVQIGLRLLVQLDFTEVFVDDFFLRRTGNSKSEDGYQQQVFHLHGGLRPYNGLLSCAGPSCYDGRPVEPPGQKTPYLTTSAQPKPKASATS